MIMELIDRYRETIRYGIFGVLAVAFNMLTFLTLNYLEINLIVANSIAFVSTVLFTYWTNTKFVFKREYSWKNFTQFFGMRMSTILIDDVGLYLLVTYGFDEFIAKIILNVVLISLNYIFSKFFIFKTGHKGDADT